MPPALRDDVLDELDLRILQAIRPGVRTVRRIAAGCNTTPANMRLRLNRLVRLGLVGVEGRATHRLTCRIEVWTA